MPANITITDIPIFPLNTVLFPKMPLSLQIFEDRYKAMVRDLPLTDNRFCVALIREGVEVGGPAEPHLLGCLAHVNTLQPLPNEMYYLNALGTVRVKITSLDRASKPYLTGSLQLWPDEGEVAGESLVRQASDLFNDYAALIMQLAGKSLEAFSLPADPTVLSYLVASILQTSAQQRQRLLEMPGSAERLAAEVALLQKELPMLRLMAHGPRPQEGEGRPFSLN